MDTEHPSYVEWAKTIGAWFAWAVVTGAGFIAGVAVAVTALDLIMSMA